MRWDARVTSVIWIKVAGYNQPEEAAAASAHFAMGEPSISHLHRDD